MAGAVFDSATYARRSYLEQLWEAIVLDDGGGVTPGTKRWYEKIWAAWDMAKQKQEEDRAAAEDEYIVNELGGDPNTYDGDVPDDDDLGVDIEEYIGEFVDPVLEKVKWLYKLTDNEFDEFYLGTVDKLLSYW